MSAKLLRPSLVYLISLCLLSAACVQKLNAQVLYGSIVGTVTDQSGALVPGAQITITNKATGLKRPVTADDAGRYTIPNVEQGVYDVVVTAAGFKPLAKTNVDVRINTVTDVDAQLEVGAVTQQVTVEASAVMLQTTKTDVHVELGTTAVTNLPLPTYRNFQSLVNLVPGATPARFQNAITDTPARALTTNINGTNRNSNNTRVDGALDRNIWLPHHMDYVPPAETIETVNISTNNFDAEQGMTGGAAVTVVTKSGTNQLHGAAFAYHDNQHLRARNFFLKSPQKPKSINNIDGAALGGPIKKDKLFFFGSWEGTRERVNRSGLFSVPTADIRRGDFTQTGTTIYIPNSGAVDANGNPTGVGRQPFPDQSMIPIDPIMKKLVDLTPLPNQPGEFSNFFSSGTQALTRDNFDGKVDWNRNDKQRVFFKYSAMNAHVLGDFALGKAGGPCICDGGSGQSSTLVQLATIGHTWEFTPNFLIDGVLGWTRLGQQVRGPDFGQNFGLDTLGIPGTNGPDPRQSGMPFFTISGYTTLGNSDNWSPLFRNDQSYTTSHNATWIHGAHEFRFGFDAVHAHLNQWQPEIGSGPRGSFDFKGGTTALNGGSSPNRFNAYAQFLLGLPNSLGKSVQFIKMNGTEWQLGWYARDRWRMTSKLTLNLGLRYEYYPLLTRNAGIGMTRIDPATNLVFVGGRGNQPRNVDVTTSKKLFAPRIGIAYRLNDSTVIRTGYGITIDPLALVRPFRSWFPFTVGSTFDGPNGFAPVGPIAQGIPSICCPDISTGAVPLPPQAAYRGPVAGPLKRGFIQSWNLIVERKLPASFVTSIGYVGTQTVRGWVQQNINAGVPGLGRDGQPFFAPFKRTVPTNFFQGGISSNYHSLQVTMNRRFTSGLFVKAAYTYSKAIGSVDDGDGTNSLAFNTPSQLARNRARQGYDIPHILQMAYMYELPLGAGKKWANTQRAARLLLGGWQVNGIFSAFSGTPFTVTGSDTSLSAPGNTQTADQVNPVVTKLDGIFDTPYYDPKAFAAVNTARFGTTGRNILRGPGAVNLDASLFRRFQLTERFQLEFRAEAFNAANTAHFANPSANVSDSKSFLKITEARPDERQFRFGLRLAF